MITLTLFMFKYFNFNVRQIDLDSLHEAKLKRRILSATTILLYVNPEHHQFWHAWKPQSFSVPLSPLNSFKVNICGHHQINQTRYIWKKGDDSSSNKSTVIAHHWKLYWKLKDGSKLKKNLTCITKIFRLCNCFIPF